MFKAFIFLLTIFPFSSEGNVMFESNSKIETSILLADHNSWNELLSKHVDSEGNVDYAAFVKDKEKLAEYLDHLDKNAPSDTSSKNEKLAYYINLYNAATVKLIIDNYPIKKLRPW